MPLFCVSEKAIIAYPPPFLLPPSNAYLGATGVWACILELFVCGVYGLVVMEARKLKTLKTVRSFESFYVKHNSVIRELS